MPGWLENFLSVFVYTTMMYGLLNMVTGLTVRRLPRLVDTPGIGRTFIPVFLVFNMALTGLLGIVERFVHLTLFSGLGCIGGCVTTLWLYHLTLRLKARVPPD